MLAAEKAKSQKDLELVQIIKVSYVYHLSQLHLSPLSPRPEESLSQKLGRTGQRLISPAHTPQGSEFTSPPTES